MLFLHMHLLHISGMNWAIQLEVSPQPFQANPRQLQWSYLRWGSHRKPISAGFHISTLPQYVLVTPGDPAQALLEGLSKPCSASLSALAKPRPSWVGISTSDSLFQPLSCSLAIQAPAAATLAASKDIPALHQECQQTGQEEREMITLHEK